MADLVVIGYPDETTAERAYDVVGQLEQDLVMQVAGAAVVVKDADGKAKMVTKTGATGAGALMGAFFGLLFGILFLIPAGGLILGGTLGALMGTLTGWASRTSSACAPRTSLKPGTAALVLFLRKWTEDKALAALAPLGGEVLKTSLSEEATNEINAALEADKTAGTSAAPTSWRPLGRGTGTRPTAPPQSARPGVARRPTRAPTLLAGGVGLCTSHVPAVSRAPESGRTLLLPSRRQQQPQARVPRSLQ